MVDRRMMIASAGVRLLARGGVRALTHHGVDDELGLTRGSTSYYARTRRDLISLVTQHLAEQTQGDSGSFRPPDQLTADSAADMMATALESSTRRSEEHTARLLLLLDQRHDPEQRTRLATDPETRSALIREVTGLLEQLGVESPKDHAPDVIALLDALLMQRTIRAATINERAVLRAYLNGLPKTSS